MKTPKLSKAEYFYVEVFSPDGHRVCELGKHKERDAAEAHAERARQQIANAGWAHSVHIRQGK